MKLKLTLPIIASLILLCCGHQANAQDAETGEENSMIERFLAIFQTPPAVTKARSYADSLGVPFNKASVPVTDRYAGIYNLIHREQKTYYERLSSAGYTRWDDLNALSAVGQTKYKSPDGDTLVLGKNVKVFGWHPHWMKNAYKNYPFQLLSHISLFSYDVNVGEGEPYANPEVIDWWESDEFDLVEMAHEQNPYCKVMITVTNFGARENKIFLSDPALQDRLIDDVVDRMVRMGANGIDLDFELVPASYEKRLSSFVRKLSKRLRAGKENYELSVVLPKVNNYGSGNNIYNIDTLQNYVDFFTLTAYDFTTGSSKAGPISPLYNYDKNKDRVPYGSIEDVVFNYLEAGMDREKLLLGLPYYGGKWTSYYRNGKRDSSSFEQPTFARIKNENRGKTPAKLDDVTWSRFYQRSSTPDFGPYDRVEEEIWFDDSLTLSVKYDWALQQELGGVGLWALGYDSPNLDLWGLIDRKFTPVNDTIVRYEPPRTIFDIPAKILRFRDPITVSGIFIFLFLAVGFVWALFDWRVREVFYQNKTLRMFYIVASFSVITATVAVLLFLRPEMLTGLGPGWLSLLTLIIGLIGGAVLVRNISRWFAGVRDEQP